jgi:hypothetical protein
MFKETIEGPRDGFLGKRRLNNHEEWICEWATTSDLFNFGRTLISDKDDIVQNAIKIDDDNDLALENIPNAADKNVGVYAYQ